MKTDYYGQNISKQFIEFISEFGDDVRQEVLKLIQTDYLNVRRDNLNVNLRGRWDVILRSMTTKIRLEYRDVSIAKGVGNKHLIPFIYSESRGLLYPSNAFMTSIESGKYVDPGLECKTGQYRDFPIPNSCIYDTVVGFVKIYEMRGDLMDRSKLFFSKFAYSTNLRNKLAELKKEVDEKHLDNDFINMIQSVTSIGAKALGLPDIKLGELVKGLDSLKNMFEHLSMAIEILPDLMEMDGTIHFKVGRNSYIKFRLTNVTVTREVDSQGNIIQNSATPEQIKKLGGFHRIFKDKEVLDKKVQEKDILPESKEDIKRNRPLKRTASSELSSVLGDLNIGKKQKVIMPNKFDDIGNPIEMVIMDEEKDD
jgi:hypothetical protein